MHFVELTFDQRNGEGERETENIQLSQMVNKNENSQKSQGVNNRQIYLRTQSHVNTNSKENWKGQLNGFKSYLNAKVNLVSLKSCGYFSSALRQIFHVRNM